MDTSGIHHVTAIAGDPQRNLDFYAGFLGLRLVKKTVNFDDPNTYHLYYGDALGHPGTILTFFPWVGMRRGQRGVGSVAALSFSVPRTSLGFWLERLSARNERFEREERFGDPVFSFSDPDGLRLELTFHEEAEEANVTPWEEGPVPPEHALRGFHSVTLWEEGVEATAALLTQRLGFHKSAVDGPLHRYTTSHAGPGRVVDVRRAENFWPGVTGAGTVHHVAFRAADDAAQIALQEELLGDGLAPTPVIDRQYFRSIYFREPGGVLFEVATDPPGFTVDEPPETLGAALKLPPQYERMRSQLEATLPPLHLPPLNSLTRNDKPTFSAPHLAFTHRWLPKAGATKTLLLLHGTGGDENDLVSLGGVLEPRANLLSPRGKVLENGLPRFFRRLAEGVFDEADLEMRADELAEFIKEAAVSYDFAEDGVTAVGYSNGANIASAALLRHPTLFRAALLLRPMVPFEPEALPELSGVSVFLGAGRRDPIVPTENVERLAELLNAAGAEVTLHWEDAGHGVSDRDFQAARRWLAGLEKSV